MFDWDDANISHIARHGITPPEAEQAITLYPLELEYQNVDSEERILMLGLTATARLIAVALTIRCDKIRVITAYPATRAQQRTYFESAGYKK